MPLSGVFFVSLPYLKKFSAKIQIFCGKAKPELVKVWALLLIKMFFKDFVSVKRQKIKRGASQTYDTPSSIFLSYL